MKNSIKTLAMCAAMAFGVSAVGCAPMGGGMELDGISVKKKALSASPVLQVNPPQQLNRINPKLSSPALNPELTKKEAPKVSELKRALADHQVLAANLDQPVELLVYLPLDATIHGEQSSPHQERGSRPTEDRMEYHLELPPHRQPGPQVMKLVVEHQGQMHTLNLNYSVR